MIVVVDTLDGCEDHRLVAEHHGACRRSAWDINRPLWFFSTSRHIGAKFGSGAAAAHDPLVRFMSSIIDARDDIHLFLRRSLTAICAERQVMRSIPQPWPDLDTLLKEILRAGPSGPSPYAGLDLLYLQIMISSIPDISSSQLVLRIIVCLFNPLSVEQLQKLHGADRVSYLIPDRASDDMLNNVIISAAPINNETNSDGSTQRRNKHSRSYRDRVQLLPNRGKKR
ncbi:hypothetical protein PILCRDRAFT_9807 [Piloderma croceum F 1598]|uniref:Uncharacterized protein n=1 Tax=Piloderma croceum (strain F 1598) TaxID=765440 RepID=A0A0C3FK42_PILCF|nr:hypothetical protein PILCRDRAFT_9807 [Piloderma croceum F 1598]